MNINKFLRFLVQPFVELLIVIVGVTIAFWLNTRAELSKEQQTVQNYYIELKSDLEADRKRLDFSIERNGIKLKSMMQAIQFYDEDIPNRDSIFAYSQLLGNYHFFEPNDITYRTMINSGDLKLISNLELKRKLVSLYDRYDVIDYLQKNHLQALDLNFFPKYVYMVDYIDGKVIMPIEEDILVKNYFAWAANELSMHIAYYKSGLEKNMELDSMIARQLN